MFQITVLTLIPNTIRPDFYNLQVRMLTSSGIEAKTQVCSGRSFHWNQKFRCSEQQRVVQFEVFHISDLTSKQKMGTGVYDFQSNSNHLVTSHERQVQLYNNGYPVGMLYIMVEFLESYQLGRQNPRRAQFGRSSQLNSPSKMLMQSFRKSSISTATKVNLMSNDVITNRVEVVMRKSQITIIKEPPTLISNARLRGLDLVKPRFKNSRNCFSCLDNCTQDWEIAPSPLHDQQ